MRRVACRRGNQVLHSLVPSNPHSYALTDEGLNCIARRDRAAVSLKLDRWTPQESDGVHFSTAMRALASASDH